VKSGLNLGYWGARSDATPYGVTPQERVDSPRALAAAVERAGLA